MSLLRRAYELWRELEKLSGERLLHITGSVDAGPAGGSVFEGALRSSELYGLPYEVMDGAELQRRFPKYGLPREMRCLYQPEGGFLLPERRNVAHVVLAQSHGAEVHCREPVLEWGAKGGRVWVCTARGRHEAGRLVVCAGAWAFLIPGFKFGKYHHLGEVVDPDAAKREPQPEDEDLLRAFARRYFPDGAGPTMMLKACLFTK